MKLKTEKHKTEVSLFDGRLLVSLAGNRERSTGTNSPMSEMKEGSSQYYGY
jgi:hypothetical protein